MRGKTVCRLHGGKGGGPKGSATAPTGLGGTQPKPKQNGGRRGRC